MPLQDIKIGDIRGLSETEAKARLKRDGYNELPSAKGRSFFAIAFGVFKEPMLLLLVACGGIYLVLGEFHDAAMLLGFVFVIIGITIYQEGKAERAIEALRDLSSPRALVIRDGAQRRISGKEVVKGDIIIIREGDRVPADAILLWGINVTADESILSGESAPVRKMPDKEGAAEFKRPGGDDLPFLYSGSLVVQGQGVAKVISIGQETEMGKIGKALSQIQEEETLLQKETGKLVKVIFAVALLLCVIVVAAYGLTRGNWMESILSGITLAMAMLPEEFPVVLTIFLALGAWRISKKDVLTRKAAAVEILGSTTVLCVDKTGTLTQNRMSIKKIFNGREFYNIADDKRGSLPEKFHEVVEYGILASKKDPFDPMEKALEELGYTTLYETEHIHKDWPLIEEYPISKEVTALSHVWETPDKEGFVVSAKGAPEAIQDLCHLSASERKALGVRINEMAAEGLRILGIAKAFFAKEKLPLSQHAFDFKFIGLIGLADPIRPSVPLAIQECYGAGIRVVMITGDYPITAQNIAKQIGLKNPETVITGPEIEKMSAEEFKERCKTGNIFSRVQPEQKLLIVNALKTGGEVVAMTGDGVNDAPALKSAQIGIAMGERGTDVAREASDIVLLNDDFSSIVEAVRLGRRIFDNLRKAMAYVISVHVPIAGAALIPVIMGWPIILYPAHIVFLELIIDPVCSIAFESEPAEKEIMKRPPRNPKGSLFGRTLLTLSFLQGLSSLVAVIAVFQVSLYFGQGEAGARALAFITLIISNICLIFTNRSWTRSIISVFSVSNKALLSLVAGTTVFLLLIIYVPFMQKAFHFGQIHSEDFLICFIAGVWSVLWFELLKVVFRKMNIDLMKA
ncbi:MAG: cation-translocating P-type ATPase [Candidatus Omnitrophica bacterium]|nr:cation-translocating P-type ATPase [Candidatus Omnitrophota bacterium]MDD5436660.1 cation-translocating P-type ATPase [Candidatus Omnitrophota bacterium]